MATKRAANRAERPGSAQRRRTTLLPHEAAHVLQLPVRNVRNLIRRGDLSDAGVDRFRRVAPDEVAQRLGGQPLAHQVLAAILDGRIHIGRVDPDAAPSSLLESWKSLW